MRWQPDIADNRVAMGGSPSCHGREVSSVSLILWLCVSSLMSVVGLWCFICDNVLRNKYVFRDTTNSFFILASPAETK